MRRLFARLFAKRSGYLDQPLTHINEQYIQAFKK